MEELVNIAIRNSNFSFFSVTSRSTLLGNRKVGVPPARNCNMEQFVGRLLFNSVEGCPKNNKEVKRLRVSTTSKH